MALVAWAKQEYVDMDDLHSGAAAIQDAVDAAARAEDELASELRATDVSGE
jgi:hypothetical protein